jgi:hypothetical protein
MKTKTLCLLAPLMLAPASLAVAQTKTTYNAPTGQVSSTMVVTMNLSPSGSAVLEPSLPNCYLGNTCTFYHSVLTYVLPDGSTASLGNFRGVFAPITNVLNGYEIKGHAHGVDSLGRTVKVDPVIVTMTITGHSGRGGGTTKTYTNGSLAVTN